MEEAAEVAEPLCQPLVKSRVSVHGEREEVDQLRLIGKGVMHSAAHNVLQHARPQKHLGEAHECVAITLVHQLCVPVQPRVLWRSNYGQIMAHV